jgi:carboxylesterase type B
MTPILDGQFLSRFPSESFAQGLVADVAILAGSNTDEGTATFFGPRGTLNGDADVHNLIAEMGVGLDNDTVSKVMELYPDDPAQGCPFNTGSERFADQIHTGRQYITQYYSFSTATFKEPDLQLSFRPITLEWH